MKKWKINCIIEHQIEVEAETLEEAVENARIEDVESDIMVRGSNVFNFVAEACQ